MLLQLNIKNFALIENLSICFDKGFNVLSGETGAGKSILIDAINYVLGGKFNKGLIRTGENKTFVEAIFSIENQNTEEKLKEAEIEFEDLVIISRETFQSGKSITKINGRSLLINNLKHITSTLLDIHGQHENVNMLNSENHIAYLDDFAGEKLNPKISKYKKKLEEYKELDKKLNSLTGIDGDKEKLIGFLKFQIEEINGANLKLGEEEELLAKFKILSNAEKINRVLQGSYEILYNGNDNSSPILESVLTITKDLKSIENSMEKVKNIVISMDEAYYIIEAALEEIRDIKDDIYYDENEVAFINSRIYQIDLYKKKYGNSISEILKYRDKSVKQYDEFINSAEIIEKIKKNIKKLECELFQIGKEIHDIRCLKAIDLEKKIQYELAFIGLEKTKFKIEVELLDKFSLEGCDSVQFLITTNPGEPLMPLEKIVSGGELSRIMLALKTVFINKDSIPTVIFDEIDSGISGRIAQSVAEKMYCVSAGRQVFCITHLPQIACMSDVHYNISKQVVDNKTFTNVTKLDDIGKESEIARMLGGTEVTKITTEHSREMIKLSNLKKMELLGNDYNYKNCS